MKITDLPNYDSIEITEEDIEFWEKHLNLQYQGDNYSHAIPFCEHLLKLAKAVKFLQHPQDPILNS